jgi:DNA repair exonuclease SbcCD nuclease subunit
MFKFLHAADLHLDSPLRGLAAYEGAPVEALRGATRRAFDALVDLALDEQAAFVLLAGDIYDGDWKDYSTGLYFLKQMLRLREAGIRVYLIAGNHDAESQITRSLRFPDNVRALATRKPETVRDETLGVAVHGQGFASRAVTEDLAANYPAPIGGMLNIGLLHTMLAGREGHQPYAPTTLQRLVDRRYDYWALGHVHQRAVLSTEPWVVYPGNLQGRHAREPGEKGATLVTVDGGRITGVEHRALDVLRWDIAAIGAAGAASGAEVIERVRTAVATRAAARDGRFLALRVEVSGPCRAHEELAARPEDWVAQVRAAALDAGGGDVWIEKVRLQTSTEAKLEELLLRDDAIADLLRSIDGLQLDPAALQACGELFAELQSKLPADLRGGDDPLDLRAPAFLGEALGDVRQLLVTRLLGGAAAGGAR